MKHCPNPDCPFLREYKMVAEFRDEVELCPDCDTQLVAGEAPDIALAPSPHESMFLKNRDLDLVTLCLLDSEADANFYKEKLEFQSIPVAIARQSVVAEDSATPQETVLFDVQVLRADLMRATLFLDTLLPADSEESETDDNALADDVLAPNANWSETDEFVEAASTATRGTVQASASPEIQAAETNVKPAGGMNQLLLLLVSGVELILVILFLINTFAK